MKLKLKHSFVGAALIGLLAGGMPAEAADKVNFEKEVWPIIERSCLKCHRAPYKDPKTGRTKKPKAGLRVDKPDLLMAGSEDGEVIVKGKPEKSSFYTLTTLDADHDDIMPPKGDPLTKEEQAILKKWIMEGADFGGWKGWDGKSSSVTTPKKAPSRLEIIAEGVKPAADSALASLRKTGALGLSLEW